MGSAEATGMQTGYEISTFDGEQHDPQLIAEAHLAVRYWQVLHQGNRFTNFFESQEDLPIIDRYYVVPGGNFFIATDKQTEEIIGFVALMNHGDGLGEIKRMAVFADRHGQGIGTTLVQTAIGWAREHNYQKIILQTGPRESGKPLYEKCRFNEVSRVLRNRDHVMELALVDEPSGTSSP